MSSKPLPRRPWVRAGALLLSLGLAGCADLSGIAPQAELRDAATLGLASQSAGTPVAAQWWQAFGDPQLDHLIARALEHNPSLKLAQARLLRARAVTEIAESAYRPQVNASLDLTHQLYSKNGLVPPPLAGTIQDSGTLQLGASWELDFFGKNRAALDAALGSTRAAQADAEAARVLLASSVARAYFQLLRIEDQLRVAQRTLQQREEVLALVHQRVAAGLDSQLELRQAEGALPEARQQSEALQEQAALARHALAALIGQPNVDPVLAAQPLQAVHPIPVAPVLPADLLGRRPDVAAARWRVEAATSEVANARTQFYPNVNLVAFAGFSSIGLDRLLQSDSQQWGVGPAVRLPLFDGGRLRANLRGRTAELDLAIESYNATVIDAVRDVADQISSMQSIARQQDEQRAAQQAAESAYALARQRYDGGLGNYLQVLSAETAVLGQRRLAVDLAARTLDTQVALLRALGGGYQPDAATSSLDGPPPSGAQAAAKSAVQH